MPINQYSTWGHTTTEQLSVNTRTRMFHLGDGYVGCEICTNCNLMLDGGCMLPQSSWSKLYCICLFEARPLRIGIPRASSKLAFAKGPCTSTRCIAFLSLPQISTENATDGIIAPQATGPWCQPNRAANEARIITCLFVLVGSVSGFQICVVCVIHTANAPRMSNGVAGCVLCARLVHRSGIYPFDLHASTSQSC